MCNTCVDPFELQFSLAYKFKLYLLVTHWKIIIPIRANAKLQHDTFSSPEIQKILMSEKLVIHLSSVVWYVWNYFKSTVKRILATTKYMIIKKLYSICWRKRKVESVEIYFSTTLWKICNVILTIINITHHQRQRCS